MYINKSSINCYSWLKGISNSCQNNFVSFRSYFLLNQIYFQDGTEWMPKDNPKICSKHFVQGEPSENEDNIDFMPTIFENSDKSGIENSKDQSQEKKPRSCKVKTQWSQSF